MVHRFDYDHIHVDTDFDDNDFVDNDFDDNDFDWHRANDFDDFDGFHCANDFDDCHGDICDTDDDDDDTDGDGDGDVGAEGKEALPPFLLLRITRRSWRRSTGSPAHMDGWMVLDDNILIPSLFCISIYIERVNVDEANKLIMRIELMF